jgi:hypothetical protein
MKANVMEFIAIPLMGAILAGCSRGGTETQVLLIRPVRADVPVVTVTNYVETSLADLNLPDFEAIPAGRWREAYDIFSAALIDEAKKCRLDSVSLSNCLKAVLISPESKGVALLPVAAYSGSQDRQKVWTIELRWEVADPLFSGEPMGHVRAHCFTQNGIKQVGFSRCH